jgi:hypothetical protein
MKHWKGILAIIVSLGLVLALLPLSITGASGTVKVSIVAPAEVKPGSSFVADVTVDWVTDFDSCDFDVTYDKAIITVTDVTDGEIDGYTIPVNEWHYVPASSTVDTGRIKVLAFIPGMPGPGITGTGRIAQLHFNVLGSSGQSSAIHLVKVEMYDYLANKIATTTVDDLVYVALVPMEITTTALPEGKVGYVYTATLAATGGKTPYTWGATGLPAGLTCSRAGVISGTPTASGDFSVTATVTDSSSPPRIVNKVLSLKVYAAVGITTTSPLPEGKVGDAYTATLAATGGKTPYTWTATGLPAGLTCSAAGVISGTPTASGDFSVTASVTDSFGSPRIVNKVLSLKVYAALGITTASPLPDGKVGQTYRAVTLVATGGKLPYTWTATGLPAGLTCSAAGVISGTPTAGGDFSVNATVTDSFSSHNIVSKVLSLKIYVPLGITTTSPLPDGKVGQAYTATLVATGGKTPYTWTATGLPAGLTCSAAGVISGTPQASGDFSINATVTDSSSPPNIVSKVLSLKIYVALGITTTSPLSEGKVGDAYPATTLVATGGKTPYTWTATGLPAGLTCSAAGVITGTPTAGGDFSVNATVTDSFSPPNIVSKVLSLKIYAALGITTTSLPNEKVGQAYTTTLGATGGKLPYTWTATGLPAGLTCSAAGVISGTSTSGGQFSVNATVTDSFSPHNTVWKTLDLSVCILGDANGDGVVDTGDITKVKRIYFGLDAPSACANVNGDEIIDTGDITAIKMIYFL